MVRGVFCLHGRFIPVADLSDRLGLPGKELAPSDRIVIARVGSRPMGFLTDGHTELVECPSREITDGDPAIFGTEAVEGVVRLSNGVAWIQNLRRLLTLADEASPIDGTAQCS
jgi:chemotaxis signal transduction protein